MARQDFAGLTPDHQDCLPTNPSRASEDDSFRIVRGVNRDPGRLVGLHRHLLNHGIHVEDKIQVGRLASCKEGDGLLHEEANELRFNNVGSGRYGAQGVGAIRGGFCRKGFTRRTCDSNRRTWDDGASLVADPSPQRRVLGQRCQRRNQT